MKALPQVLLTVLLVGAGLWIYDTVRSEAGSRGADATLDGAALESRIEALAAQVRALEDQLAARRDADAPSPPAGSGSDAIDLDRLEGMVRELERREEIQRLTNGAKAQLRALGLGLTDAEHAKALDLLVRFEAERADLWRQLRHEAIADKEEIARRFTPIRERYEASLRHTLPEAKARAIIAAVLR